MKISDIAALVEIGHSIGAIVVVDNTFASPYLQQPLSFGADVVVHSTTKYLGGHSDVLGGAVIVNDEELAEKIGFLQFGVGAVSGPLDAWLTVRGIKTLAVRLDRHSSNAQTIAEALVGHKGIDTVYYPGLPDHPGHELAARQMKAFGGMISLKLNGGGANGAKVRRVDEAVPARRVARWRRVAHVLPVRDDARLGARHRARGARERRAPLGRHRGCRRPARRRAAGARPDPVASVRRFLAESGSPSLAPSVRARMMEQ